MIVTTVVRLPPRVSMSVEVAVVLVDGSVDSGSAASSCVSVGGSGGGVSRLLETAVLDKSSVDSGSATASVSVSVEAAAVSTAAELPPFCVAVSVEGIDIVRRPQSRVLQSAEHLEAAVVTDGSVDSGSSAAACVGVGGGGGGVHQRL